MPSNIIHGDENGTISFSLWLNTSPPVDGDLGCFHILAIVNNAAINIVVHISFWINVLLLFFGGDYTHSSGIVGSYGSSIVVFGEITLLFSIVAVPSFSPTNSVPGFPFPTSLPTFVIYVLFDDGHSDRCEVISHHSLICISLMIGNVEHLFMWYTKHELILSL